MGGEKARPVQEGILWEELCLLVFHYPVEPALTLSHQTMAELDRWGYAVRDKLGRWIPTGRGIHRYYHGPQPHDRGEF